MSPDQKIIITNADLGIDTPDVSPVADIAVTLKSSEDAALPEQESPVADSLLEELGSEAIEHSPVAELFPAEIVEAQPTFADIMRDGHTIMRSLSDPDLDVATRVDVHATVNAWSELRQARATQLAWDELIVPHLAAFDEISPTLTQQVAGMSHIANQLSDGLGMLANALYEPGQQGIQMVQQVMQRYRFNELTAQLTGAAPLITEHGMRQNALLLQGGEEQAAEVVQNVATTEAISNDEATFDALAAEVDGMTAKASIEQFRGELAAKKYLNWRQKREVLQDVVTYSRMTDDTDTLQKEVTAFAHQMDVVGINMMYGAHVASIEVDVAQMRVGVLARVKDELERTDRLLRVARMSREQAD